MVDSKKTMLTIILAGIMLGGCQAFKSDGLIECKGEGAYRPRIFEYIKYVSNRSTIKEIGADPLLGDSVKQVVEKYGNTIYWYDTGVGSIEGRTTDSLDPSYSRSDYRLDLESMMMTIDTTDLRPGAKTSTKTFLCKWK